MTPILKLTGVGPALAKALQNNGIKVVEDIAKLSVEDLRKVPGIGISRAQKLLDATQSMIGAVTATETAAPTPKPAASAPKTTPKPEVGCKTQARAQGKEACAKS